MNIVIYDDNVSFIAELEKNIEIINAKHNGIFSIMISGSQTETVINYIKSNPSNTIYLLDIVADDTLRGFQLAKLIQSADEENIIIYITDYPSKIAYNMRQKLTALCFIIKSSSQFSTELETSLLYAYKLLSSKSFYIAENNKAVYRISLSDIYYFEKLKATHNICVMYKNGYTIFKGSLHEIQKKLDHYFCYCHKSIIVNTQNIKEIDKNNKNRIIYFDNGQNCPYSVFYKGELLKWIRF